MVVVGGILSDLFFFFFLACRRNLAWALLFVLGPSWRDEHGV